MYDAKICQIWTQTWAKEGLVERCTFPHTQLSNNLKHQVTTYPGLKGKSKVEALGACWVSLPKWLLLANISRSSDCTCHMSKSKSCKPTVQSVQSVDSHRIHSEGLDQTLGDAEVQPPGEAPTDPATLLAASGLGAKERESAYLNSNWTSRMMILPELWVSQ